MWYSWLNRLSAPLIWGQTISQQVERTLPCQIPFEKATREHKTCANTLILHSVKSWSWWRHIVAAACKGCVDETCLLAHWSQKEGGWSVASPRVPPPGVRRRSTSTICLKDGLLQIKQYHGHLTLLDCRSCHSADVHEWQTLHLLLWMCSLIFAL